MTQNLALHLNRHHPGENRMHLFSRSEESKNGSDFVWLFFDQEKKKHLRIVVQAKRLYSSGRYEAFKSEQVEKIQEYSGSIGGEPFYLFYGYPDILSELSDKWKEKQRDWSGPILDHPRDLGILLVHSGELSGIKNGQLSPDNIIVKHCFPMWRPFCTCQAQSSKRRLAEIAEGFMRHRPEESGAADHGFKLQKTPDKLLDWFSGKKLGDGDWKSVFEESEREEDGFQPSFVMGTVI